MISGIINGGFMDYEYLLKEADNLGVIVKEANLITKDGYCKGFRIAINKKLVTNKEKKCILAEELGHYHKTVGNITDQSKINNRKQEIIARRWGYEKLISIDYLITCYKKGIPNKYEIAEFFDVTEEFLNESLSYYRDKYGAYYRIDKYIISFDPLWIIEKFEDF